MRKLIRLYKSIDAAIKSTTKEIQVVSTMMLLAIKSELTEGLNRVEEMLERPELKNIQQIMKQVIKIEEKKDNE